MISSERSFQRQQPTTLDCQKFSRTTPPTGTRLLCSIFNQPFHKIPRPRLSCSTIRQTPFPLLHFVPRTPPQYSQSNRTWTRVAWNLPVGRSSCSILCQHLLFVVAADHPSPPPSADPSGERIRNSGPSSFLPSILCRLLLRPVAVGQQTPFDQQCPGFHGRCQDSSLLASCRHKLVLEPAPPASRPLRHR